MADRVPEQQNTKQASNRSRSRSRVGKSIRRSLKKTPKYALIILHPPLATHQTDTAHDHKRGCIDYVSLVLHLVIFSLIAAVGTMNLNLKGGPVVQSCPLARVPLFLMIAGFANIVLSVFRLFFTVAGAGAQCLFNFVMCIYGGYVVFSNYDDWTSKDPNEVTYCNYVPFMIAFVYVIIQIIYFGTIIFMLCIVLTLVGCGMHQGQNEGPLLSKNMDIIMLSKNEFLSQVKRMKAKKQDKLKASHQTETSDRQGRIAPAKFGTHNSKDNEDGRSIKSKLLALDDDRKTSRTRITPKSEDKV